MNKYHLSPQVVARIAFSKATSMDDKQNALIQDFRLDIVQYQTFLSISQEPKTMIINLWDNPNKPLKTIVIYLCQIQ